jgi:hypothetical protein
MGTTTARGAGVRTTDNQSLEQLVTLLRQSAAATAAGPEEKPDPRRRTAGWLALAAFGVALLVPIVLVAVAIAPRLPAARHPTPFPAGATFASRATRSSTPPAAVPAPLPPAALALSRTELTTLAARLPSHVVLTAPAGWLPRSGGIASDPRPAGSCPRIFGWIANRLGGDWTYAAGALPQGTCSWAPEPFSQQQPTPDRFVVQIGFQSGDERSLLNRPPLCVSGTAAPGRTVPAVARGAVLVGCDDGILPGFELRVPDASGRGVWFLSSVSGANQHTYSAGDGLLAALDAATHAFG